MRKGTLGGGILVAAFGGAILFFAYRYSPTFEHTLTRDWVLKPAIYDLALIGGWALVIIGACLAILWLATSDQTSPSPWPPGWYSDPGGHGKRFWNGAAWTDQVSPAQPPPPPAGSTASPPPPLKQSQETQGPSRRRTWIAAGGAVVVFVLGAVVAIGFGLGDDTENETTSEAAVSSSTPGLDDPALSGSTLSDDPADREAAAISGASAYVDQAGISIPPEDWNASCAVADHGSYSCDVASIQCSGTVRVSPADAYTVADQDFGGWTPVADPDIGCLE